MKNPQRLTGQNTSYGDVLQIRVTHPFHPRSGNTYNVVRISNASGKTTLRCSDDEGNQFHIPANLTNYGHDDNVIIEGKESLFLDFQNLLELREVVDRLMNVQ